MSEFIEDDAPERNWTSLLLAIIMLAHVGLCGWCAIEFAPSLEEVDRLASGVLILNERDFSTEATTPLTKVAAALPLWIQGQQLNWDALRELISERTEFPHQRVNLWNSETTRPIAISRLCLIPFSIVGLLYCFFWAKECFGDRAGIVAAMLWALFPGIVGYAGMISPHVAAAALGVATFYHLRSWLIEPTLAGVIIFGFVSGLAVLSKLVWISAYFIAPVTWLLFLMIFQAGHWGLARFLGQALQLLLALVISLAVVNGGYGVQGTLLPLRDYEFESEPPLSKPVDDHFGYPGKKLGSIIVALPQPYVEMLDQWWLTVSKRQPILSINDDDVFLARAWYAGAPFAIRIPLPVVVLALLALAWYLKNNHFLVNDGHTVSLLLLVPAAGVFTWVLFVSTFREAYADALVCVPFLLIWVSVLWFDSGEFPMSRLPRWAGYVLLVGYLASSINALPHGRWYVNYSVGGEMNQHQWLKQTEVGWGEDLLELRDWICGQRDVSQVSIAYQGWLDPQYFEFAPFDPTVASDSETLRPGWYALSEELVSESPFAEREAISVGLKLKVYEIVDPRAVEEAPANPEPTPETEPEVPEIRA